VGKLGVREKSLIHQVVRQSTPAPSPPFHLGFIPAFLQDFDDPSDGVPGGVGNFNQTPSGGGTTNNFTTNNFLFQSLDAEDGDNGAPNSSTNFAATPATDQFIQIAFESWG
jgi:hypothetical protein